MPRTILAVVALMLLASPALSQGDHAQPPAKAAAPKFACPMKCEGDKTYEVAGKCPVCQMNLKEVAAPEYSITVSGPGGAAVKGNEPTVLTIQVLDATGTKARGLEDAGNGLMHVYIVLRDLASFVHAVPQAQPNGVFSFSQTLPPGEYTVFAEFKPEGRPLCLSSARLSVSGKAANPKAMGVDADRPRTVDGCAVTLSGYKDAVKGKKATLTYHVLSDGKPVSDIQPGASVVAISPNLKSVVHGAGTPGAGPDLAFTAEFSEAGLYRVWLQFERGGKLSTVPFVIEVADAK